jgi:hypothetical protein
MGEKRALQRSGGDSRNQDGLEKKPRGEASSNSRLSPDHAVRQYQLYDQQRLQEQQSNTNSRNLNLMERLYALAQIQSLSKDEFIEKYINELQIKDQECDDTENALIVCSKIKDLDVKVRENYNNMADYIRNYKKGLSRPDVASGKKPLLEEKVAIPLHEAYNQAEPETHYFLKQLDVPLGQATQTQRNRVHDQIGTSRGGVSSDVKPLDFDLHLGQADSTRKYTLIDFANEALRLNDLEYNIPLNEGMLSFTVENPFTVDRYNLIRHYLSNNGVNTLEDIERKMYRVYRYNLAANNIRRSSGYNATANKIHSTDQQ